MAPNRVLLTLFLLLLKNPSLKPETYSCFIIWNVGQGSFSTFVTQNSCLHIDMGGQHLPLSPLLHLCREKKNFLALTHFDRDHTNFIWRLKFRLGGLCLLNKKPFSSLTHCRQYPQSLKLIQRARFKVKNDSHIFSLRNLILVTGDAPKKIERQLTKKDPVLLKEINYLLVGHHGSQTSSSTELLQKLKGLKLAIVSAKKSVYGHPHWRIRKAFHKKRTPLITTESFGHIQINLE